MALLEKKQRRALISVSDKNGISEFASSLVSLGFEIISTGGTANLMRDKGVHVTDVSKITGFPEIMDGRVKTLHPSIHGGLLARRDVSSDMQQAEQNDISMIDLLCVNLYPFEKTIEQNPSLEDAIENIDIGGPAMIRAAAKNYRHVIVVTDVNDYKQIIEELQKHGDVLEKTRKKLAVKVFGLMQRYNGAIEEYLNSELLGGNSISLKATDGKELRYGENSHQKAKIFRIDQGGSSLYDGKIVNGKEMSYNNYLDAESAVQTLAGLDRNAAAAVVVKHGNPCGVATSQTIAEALEKAWEGDPVSAFGGVVAVNGTVDMATANFLKGGNLVHQTYQCQDGEYIPVSSPTGKFIEILIAPSFEQSALDFLISKSKTLRIIQYDVAAKKEDWQFRQISGAMLMQTPDDKVVEKYEVRTRQQPPEGFEGLVEFGMSICRQMSSNSICVVRKYGGDHYQLMGMGVGQPNRIDAIRKLAMPKVMENLQREYKERQISEPLSEWAAKELSNMILISDAFFPFDDSVREAGSMGVRHIAQPGGSMKDDLSLSACDKLGLSMIFTGYRHFKH